MADLIADFMACIKARLGDSVDFTDLELQVRQEWGGRWVYVNQRGQHARRDDMIRIALRGGLSVKQVAQNYGLSEKQVRRIAAVKK